MRKLAKVCLLFLIMAAAPSYANEFKHWLKANYEAEHYQQTEYMPVDPKGDAFMIRKLDQIPKKLIEALIKSSYPQAEIEKEKQINAVESGYEIGKTRPIDPDRLVNMLHKVIYSYYPHIVPTIGQEHEWSPKAKRYLMYGFWHRLGRHVFRKQKEFPSPLFFRSKLFLMLACGWTSRYAITGKEAALTERILMYPDRSMQLHHMFRESYVLNNGNLYLTFLTAENVLAGDPYRVDRDDDPIQKKLAYLRHDSVEIGDNYGAWYHFFGLALYGIVRTGTITRAVAEIESLGSFFLEGADKQEDYLNRYAAVFIRKFRQMINKEAWKEPLAEDARTDYMLPNPAKAK